MNRVRQGEFGVPYTSDGVFDETVTVALVHAGSYTTAIKVGKTIIGSKEAVMPALARLIRVDERIYAEA